MKNAYDVLRQRELDLERIQKEVEALKIVAPLLHTEDDQPKEPVAPVVGLSTVITVPVQGGITAVLNKPKELTTAPNWDAAAKRWP